MKIYLALMLSLLIYGSSSSAQVVCPQPMAEARAYSAGQQVCFGRGWNSTTLNTCGGDGRWIFSGQKCVCNNSWTSGGEDGWYGCSSDWSLAANENKSGNKINELFALTQNTSAKE